MKALPLEKTKLTVAELAELVKQGPVILTCKGKPAVSVTDVTGEDWECIALANNPRFIEIIEASRRSYREHGGITHEELGKKLGLLPAKPRRSRKRKTPAK
jgi:hypothetical protein